MRAIGLLAAARRVAIVIGVAVLLLIVWLSARRAGRAGLDLAILMWAGAAIFFFLATFGPFRPIANIIMVLLACALIVVSVVALLMLGLRSRRARLARHRSPPGGGDGW